MADDVKTAYKDSPVRCLADRDARFRDGLPHLKSGTYYFYWWGSDHKWARAVYNIPERLADMVRDRLVQLRDAPYLELVGDIPGAGYADEGAIIEYVPEV